MEEMLKVFLRQVATGVEGIAGIFILVGAIETLGMLVRRALGRGGVTIHRKAIWVQFAMWLMLALEFELAADVLRSAISPTWDDIGQLGAVAVIRTFLNYFLEQDLERYASGNRPQPDILDPPATVLAKRVGE